MRMDKKRVAYTALLSFLWAATALPALADVKDYAFELVQSEVRKGADVDIAVRLLNKTTGKPVADATIIATRIDMTPAGMPMMNEPIEASPGDDTGIYHFKTKLPMAGSWQLSLAAKVQGEAGTVESKLILKASP